MSRTRRPGQPMQRSALAAGFLVAAGLAGSATPSHAVEPGCPGSASPDPAVLHCDDFEDPAPLTQRWNAVNDGGGRFVPVSDEGVAGSRAMRVRFDPGVVSAGRFSIGLGSLPPFYRGGGENWLHIVEPDLVFREIYWREYVRLEAGWNGIPNKQSRVRVLVEPAADDLGPHRTAFQGHFWPDTNPNNAFPDGVLFFNNTRGADAAGNVFDRGNSTGTSIWLPRTPGATVLYGDRPSGSDWLCIEAHVRLNDPGQQNGVEEFWIDDTLDARRIDQDHVGGYAEHGLNQVVFENYWNGGSPQQNVIYRDNMVVSTAAIGCLAAEPPVAAAPPSQLSTDALPSAPIPRSASEAEEVADPGPSETLGRPGQPFVVE